MIEFLDFRKTDVYLRATRITTRLDQFRQTVQGLRAKHHIHIRRALDDHVALLTGDTAAHPDQQVGIGSFKRSHAPQIGKHLFFGLLAYRTGIEQNDISLFDLVCLYHSVAGAHHIRHLFRVILVHLAAISLYIKFFHCGAMIPSKNIHSNRIQPMPCGCLNPQASAANKKTSLGWFFVCISHCYLVG